MSDTMWQPGDIAVEHASGFLDRLIQFGQHLCGDRQWEWNHALIVTDTTGSTIEAQGKGVVTGWVGGRDVLRLGCPPGVDRTKVVEAARAHLGDRYSYTGVVLMGIDCLLHSHLHEHSERAEFCSELAVEALQAGGWASPLPASDTKPGDLADEAFNTGWA